MLKWFVRFGLGAAALGSLAITPLALFVGVMATDSVGITCEGDCASHAIAMAHFIMATPAILCGIFTVALVWAELRWARRS